MRICYFGDYKPDYPRTRVILNGLKKVGIEVLRVNVRSTGWKMYVELWQKHKALTEEYDVMIVGFGDSRLMPVFAKILTRKPVIWEALFSQYDNWIFDRKLAKPHSLKAYYYWFTDWLGCTLSDLVLLDTHHHTTYFTETFGVPQSKLSHVYVGADTDIFFPREREKKSENLEVEFHGYYFPMQGADVIVRAANLLRGEGVHFTMIGGGQEVKSVHALAENLKIDNVTFFPFLPQEEIVGHIQNADVCIGLIGGVPRVVRALPTKIWESSAMARVGINADSASLREVYIPGVDVIGIEPGNPNALADALRDLKRSGKAEEMGRAARKKFLEYGTPEIIGQSLVEVIEKHFPSPKVA